MSLLPKLKQLLRITTNVHTEKVDNSIDNRGGLLVLNAAPAEKTKQKIVLTDAERRILIILAEGGRAVPASDEMGRVIQVNIYNHPDADSVDCVAPETLSAYRGLLRKGLIAEIVLGNKHEYVATEKGRSELES